MTISDRMILALGNRFLIAISLFLTGALVSSQRAWLAIHLPDLESESVISIQVRIAVEFRAMFRLPICLSAQLTAFLTKLRSSEDSLMIAGGIPETSRLKRSCWERQVPPLIRTMPS